MAKRKTAILRAETNVSRSKPIEEFLKGLELEAIRIVRTHADLVINQAPLEPEKFALGVQIGIGVNAEERKLLGDLIVKILPEMPASKKSPPQSGVTISVVVQAVYGIKSDDDFVNLSDEQQAAIRTMIQFSAWPYARQHIQYLSAGMGILPITLPLFRAVIQGSMQPAEKATKPKRQ